ncbi:hypothetical protein ON010_g7381 [Phytophthora cinnamomi]|nr:hypothetical protein ON010_g7381 [Phytophthora cinnamomi]
MEEEHKEGIESPEKSESRKSQHDLAESQPQTYISSPEPQTRPPLPSRVDFTLEMFATELHQSERIPSPGVSAFPIMSWHEGLDCSDSSSCVESLQHRLVHTYYPWLADFHPWLIGYKPAGDGEALFDCSKLGNFPVPYGKCRHAYFVELFFQKRYYESQKKRSYDPSKRSSPEALAESWSSFVKSMRQSPQQWLDKFRKLEHDFICYNIEGAKMEIHRRSIDEGVRCCLRRGYNCPMCYVDSARASRPTRLGKNGRVSSELFAMIKSFERLWRDHVNQARDKAMIERLANETDESYLAQMDQAWIEQKIRDTDSEMFKVYRMNLQLRHQVEEMESREHETHDIVAEMKEDLAEMQETLDAAGISRRRKLE